MPYSDSPGLATWKITSFPVREPRRNEPKVVAIFSFRFDAQLVPDLVANISPFVHAYVALDDTASPPGVTDEYPRRNALHAEARRQGAAWILAVDPDERFEPALRDWMPVMTAPGREDIVWRFQFREMVSASSYRDDGLWGSKSKIVLYPASLTFSPLTQPHHGSWFTPTPATVKMDTGLNIYHLRHLSHARVQHRRDTYAAIDPLRTWQPIGYDYLTDERGAKIVEIPPDRRFVPPHHEDDDLWASPLQIAAHEIQPDPLDSRLLLVDALCGSRGNAAAAYVMRDLLESDPDDIDLRLMAAMLFLRAGDAAQAGALVGEPSVDEPLLAKHLRAKVSLAQGDVGAARLIARNLAKRYPDCGLVMTLREDAERGVADFSSPSAAWRRHAGPGATAISEGPANGRGPLTVIVLSHQGGADPSHCISALAKQSDKTEIVIVHSGSLDCPGANRWKERVRLVAVASILSAGAARNIGMAASRGDIVSFIAADCIALSGWTQGRLRRHKEGHVSVATAVRPARPRSPVGVISSRVVFPRRTTDVRADIAGMFGRSYPRSAMAEAGFFSPGLRVSEDTEYNARIDKLLPVIWAPEICVRHSDPPSVRVLLADIRTRAKRSATDFRPFYSTDGTWLDSRARIRAARDAISQPARLNPLRRLLENALVERGQRAYLEGAREAEPTLCSAAKEYVAAQALKDDPGKAVVRLREACRLAPQVVEYQIELARALHQTKDPALLNEAMTVVDTALALRPERPAALTLLDEILTHRASRRDGHLRAEWATVMAPNSRAAAITAAHAAIRVENFALAIFHAQRAMLAQPADLAAHLLLVRLYRRTGNAAMADKRQVMIDRIRRERVLRTGMRQVGATTPEGT